MAFSQTAFLKFDNEEDWKTAAAAVGVLTTEEVTNEETGEVETVEVWNHYTHDWAVDVIGVIYDPGTYDDDGNELTAPVAHDGYHVNVKWKGNTPATFSTRSVAPSTPRRIFLGD